MLFGMQARKSVTEFVTNWGTMLTKYLMNSKTRSTRSASRTLQCDEPAIWKGSHHANSNIWLRSSAIVFLMETQCFQLSKNFERNFADKELY